MRLTLAHTYDFGADAALVGRELVRPGAWDALRQTSGPFGLPDTRAEWEARAASPELSARARDVARVAGRLGARSLCSHGVGTAMLELGISRAAPELRLLCTDFAPRTVERLSELFPEATVVVHDLVRDEPLGADLHLMHRIDTELTDAQWRGVFGRYPAPILLVPVLVLDVRETAKALARRVRHPHAARAGRLRSEGALRSLWRPTHEDERLRIGDATAYLLKPRLVHPR